MKRFSLKAMLEAIVGVNAEAENRGNFTGWLPRMAGWNFQLRRAARIFAVISAGPASSTRTFFKLPEASRVQVSTMRVRGKPSARSVRIPTGAARVAP